MAAIYYNHNQILGVQLIPVENLLWRVADMLVPYPHIFHWQHIREKKQLVIAHRVNNQYRSLLDDTLIPNGTDGLPKLDAVITTDPIPLILDTEDISFKSSADTQRAGTLYTNKLEYSLQKMTGTEYAQVEQQLQLLQSGSAYHLLFSLYGCDAAKSIILCPETGAFNAKVEDSVSDHRITITLKTLTTNQYLQ